MSKVLASTQTKKPYVKPAFNVAATRLDWIDRARGIGIILVVYGHVILGMYGVNLHILNKDLFIQYLVIYSFHMPLFFFLSGLLANHWSQKNFKVAILSKANSLLRPYLIWGVIQGLVIMAMSSYTQGQISWADILSLPLKPYAQFWFIYVLFFIFLLFYLFKRLKNERIIVAIVAILFLVSPLLSNTWVLGQITFNLAFFMCGVYFSKYKSLHIKQSIMIPTAVFALVAFSVVNYLLYAALLPSSWNILLQFVVAIAGIIITVAVARLKFKPLEFIGKFTMPIYLLHVFFASGTRVVLTRFGLSDNVVLTLTIGTVLGVMCPIAIYLIVERLKLNKYLF